MTTLLRVLTGSRASGLARPDSDTDHVVVWQRPTVDLLGLKDLGKDSTHTIDGDVDVTRHELGKFLRLAASGTPSVVQVFFDPVLEVTPTGQRLLDEVPVLALSQDLKLRFLGYANQCLRTPTPKSLRTAYRLLTHLGELWTTGQMSLPLPDPHAALEASYDDVVALMRRTEDVVSGPSVLPEHPDLEGLHHWLVDVRLAAGPIAR